MNWIVSEDGQLLNLDRVNRIAIIFDNTCAPETGMYHSVKAFLEFDGEMTWKNENPANTAYLFTGTLEDCTRHMKQLAAKLL